jgi:hypothetical protein
MRKLILSIGASHQMSMIIAYLESEGFSNFSINKREHRDAHLTFDYLELEYEENENNTQLLLIAKLKNGRIDDNYWESKFNV